MTKPAVTITIALFALFTFAGENDQLEPSVQQLDITNEEETIFPDPSLGSIFGKDKKKNKGYKNRRQERPIGFNLGVMGPGGLAGASLDGFLGPKFALEAGAGLRNTEGDFSYFVGGRYHLLGGTRLNLTPYVGGYTTFHYNGRDVQNHAVYFPVGIHRIKKSGFNWSAEVGYLKSLDTDRNLHGQFKIGYRF